MSASDSVLLRASFAGLWDLGEHIDPASELEVSKAIENPDNYVIKPQREGGGNNIYGAEVKEALLKMTKKELNAYILMQRIFPVKRPTAMLRAGEVIVGSAISELGIYSTYLSNGTSDAPILNKFVGHLLRTKLDGVNEGGVASGFAVLDSPFLVDE